MCIRDSFLGGLFVVINGLEKSDILNTIATYLVNFTSNNVLLTIPLITMVCGSLSGLVDNIPITMLLIPLVRKSVELTGSKVLWWCLITGAGLGGNLTPLASPSNVIAINVSKSEGHPIELGEFIKTGTLVALIHLFVSILYLSLLNVLGVF